VSGHITENGKRYTLMDYILSESIRPKPTPFGINEETDNYKYLKFTDPTDDIATLFKDQNNYYMVTVRLDNGEVLLERGNFYSIDPADYSMDRYQTSNAILVFSKACYIALMLVKVAGLKQICFLESNAALGSVYKRLVYNDFFLSDLYQLGFGYAGERNGYHIFKKLI